MSLSYWGNTENIKEFLIYNTFTMKRFDFKPADRISKVAEYYFSVKLKEIAAMRAEEHDIINLGIGSPDLPPHDNVVESLCMESHKSNAHGYQPYIGIPELRGAFAEWYKRWYGVELNPNSEVLPLMGSKEGIMHISMAFLNKGDGVLVPNPGYPTYTGASKLVGANIINYSLVEDNGWWPDFDSLEKCHRMGIINLDAVKLMWCNYPNMPTGAPASRELFEKIVAFGRKWNIIICHDNPYSFILNDNPLSILSVDGAKECCIELNSLSKASNMPGWRIGMLASNSKFVEWILRVKSNMDSGMFRPIQIAAVEALMLPRSWYEQMNEVYAGRRAVARAILEAVGCRVDDRQTGLFLWGKIVGGSSESSCEPISKQLCDKLLYKCGVFLAPGVIFGSNGNNYMRISLCCDNEMLCNALSRVENC